MEVSPAKSLILSATIHGGSYFFIQPEFVNVYEPCKIAKITPCKFTCKGVYFCYFYRRQRGIYSLAVHGVTFSFALNFLDLTTFLRQILGKIYSSDFLTTFLRQRLMVYTTAGTVSGRFILDISFST